VEHACRLYACAVEVFRVVSAETESAVELFLEREQAEAFIADVAGDEPATAARLTAEPVEFEQSPN
jgi:hypothetical protein